MFSQASLNAQKYGLFCGLSNWQRFMHLVRRGQKVRVYRRFCGRKSGYKRKKTKKRGIDVYVRNSLRPGPVTETERGE